MTWVLRCNSPEVFGYLKQQDCARIYYVLSIFCIKSMVYGMDMDWIWNEYGLIWYRHATPSSDNVLCSNATPGWYFDTLEFECFGNRWRFTELYVHLLWVVDTLSAFMVYQQHFDGYNNERRILCYIYTYIQIILRIQLIIFISCIIWKYLVYISLF